MLSIVELRGVFYLLYKMSLHFSSKCDHRLMSKVGYTAHLQKMLHSPVIVDLSAISPKSS